MRLQARERSLLSVLLLVLIGIGMWHLVLSSLWNRYLQAAESVHVFTDKLASAKLSMTERPSVLSDQNALQAVLARMNAPTEGDAGTIAVRRLMDATKGLQMRLLEIKPATEQKNGMFYVMPVSLRGDGEYGALMNYLLRLHNTLPVYEVTKVQINSDAQNSNRVTFTLSITARRLATVEESH